MAVRLGDNSLIGINAVLLNGSKIGKNCVIGAGALDHREYKEIPDGSLVVGAPGRVMRSAKALDEISRHQGVRCSLCREWPAL